MTRASLCLLLVLSTGCYTTRGHRHTHLRSGNVVGAVAVAAVVTVAAGLAVQGLVHAITGPAKKPKKPAKAKATTTEEDLARRWRKTRDRHLGR